jgi:hypothetical protein
MIAYVPAFVCLLGLILYVALNSPSTTKTQQLGLHMFWCGLLVLLLHLSGHAVRVIP